jgi:glycosyltransferase involved in cell wall biosynthesis
LKISVITVTYNSAETLETTLQSLIEQDYAEREYIIVDGGSTDGTLQIINKYRSHFAQVISEKDNGLYDALNKGIALSTGDVIGILHSDDFYQHSKVLSHYADTFAKSGAEAVYADLYYVDRINTDKIIRKWHSGNYHARSFYRGWMPPHPTFFVKREVYQKFGDFDLNFKTAADYELMLRFILNHKIRIAYLNEFTVKMRMGGASNASVNNRVKANQEDRKAWKKNGLTPMFYTLYLKPLRKISQFF